MPRDGEDARKRLRVAALELFDARGFDQTTAAEIAARAGVTERTFFRHFPDKREVLFEGQHLLGTALSAAIATAPPGLSPIEILRLAFASVVEMLEGNRPYSESRQRIIAATPALQERETAKSAGIALAVSEALQKRGVDRMRADLAAQAGGAVLSYALRGWLADPSRRLQDYLDQGFGELEQFTSPKTR